MGKERECVPFEEQKESKNPDLFWRQPQKSQRIEELWSGSKFRTKNAPSGGNEIAEISVR